MLKTAENDVVNKQFKFQTFDKKTSIERFIKFVIKRKRNRFKNRKSPSTSEEIELCKSKSGEKLHELKPDQIDLKLTCKSSKTKDVVFRLGLGNKSYKMHR